ncbi:DNA alkylation repair protein [Calycomorphotria hydatis]|uniref:DNA alkylation repair enzyme n=1 Tax=Calycomorphotria hydatis TaxID=2528027 RepID=A0A517TDM8_9PLAN|nr:DNA alkylation repair protein [Calycomorphotria hydatis]QDT66469.1 hypothetical protein V22_37360 [Calycomorphotria hydatis]
MGEGGKGARSMGEIPPAVLRELNAGTRETRNLVEGLAVDFTKLLRNVAPEVKIKFDSKAGVTKKMALVGGALHEAYGLEGYERFRAHPSDTVRGWSAFTLATDEQLTLKQRIDRIKPLADDSHFGVREWAWLAIRPWLASQLDESILRLSKWTSRKSENLRRFACEALRPRGVWCAHITELKQEPQRAMAILEPLKSDPSKYVQDSVANWLNDAGKSQPGWVRKTCARWLEESDSAATERICKRALRNLR